MQHAAELEEVVLKEAKKLEQFFPRIVSCRVAIEAPARIRVDLGVPGEELVIDHDASHHPDRHRRSNLEIAIHEAFHEMRGRLQAYADRIRGAALVVASAPNEGVVTKLLEDYGFLEADGHGVYFHRNSVIGGNFDSLRVGSRVHFCEEEGDKGPQASTVKLLHPGKQRRTAASSAVLPRYGAA